MYEIDLCARGARGVECLPNEQPVAAAGEPVSAYGNVAEQWQFAAAITPTGCDAKFRDAKFRDAEFWDA